MMKFFKTRRRRIISLSLFVTFLYFIYSFQRYAHPYDEIKVEIRDLPSNSSFICLVAQTENGPKAINWTHTNMLCGRSSMHPDSCTMSFIGDSEIPRNLRLRVMWIYSQRIGILIKSKDGQWNVSWFRPVKVELKEHSLLFGGGSVAIDFANADETEPMSVEQLKKLGMDYSLTHDGD